MRVFFLLITSFVILFTYTLEATIINVPFDYSTIQDGIDVANLGDTILVADGIYTGVGNRDISFNGKEISVISENGSEFTIIDCEGTDIDPHIGFFFNNNETNNSILEGFSIINGYADEDFDDTFTRGGGVYCYNSSPTLRELIFQNNYSQGGGALICREGSTPEIINCLFDNNSADWGGGISSKEGSAPHIVNCIFKNNTATIAGGAIDLNNSIPLIEYCIMDENDGFTGGAVKFYDGADAELRNCTIVNNISISGSALNIQTSSPEIYNTIIALNYNSEPVVCVDWANPVFYCTDIYGNDVVDWGFCIFNQFGINGNFSADPKFCNISSENFHPIESSPCAPGNNDCEVLLGSEEITLSCDDDATIFVTQDGTGDATTIQGGVDLATLGDTILVAPGLYQENVLFDFPLTVLSEDGVDVTIIESAVDGQSILRYNGNSDMTFTLEGFTIRGARSVDFAVLIRYCPLNIRNNKVTDNQNCMNFVFDGPTGEIVGNEVWNNTGPSVASGIYCALWNNGLISENIVHDNDNSQCSGIRVERSDSIEISKNIIYNCSGEYGGAIYLRGNDYSILNNTVYNCSGTSFEAAIWLTEGDGVAINNIIASSIDNYGIGTDFYMINSNHNLFFNNSLGDYLNITPGTNDIYHNPDFVDAVTGDLSLNCSSPCIDSALTMDPIYYGLGQDIGALEYQYAIGNVEDVETEMINISDVVFLINYIFSGGQAPCPLASGNADCIDIIDISDAIYLIDFIFNGGPAPCE